jgi:hypothetical protein
MILNEDLRSNAGILLAAKGFEVSQPLLKAVRNLVEHGTVKGTVLITIETRESSVAKGAAGGAS